VLTDGLTTIVADVAPVLQINDAPPEAVNIVDDPGQIVKFPDIVAVGSVLKVTVLVKTAVQPLGTVTVTE
jgi:hypothetical protein